MEAGRRLRRLDDGALMRGFAERLRSDRAQTAELVRYIEEIDRRQVWAKLGHPSMFDLCVRRFHMSESIAAKRIRAARTARRLPVVIDMLARGDIHLSGLHRLAKHLTEDNHREVLAEARHKTLREIDEIVARLAPRPDVPSRLRAVAPGAGGDVHTARATNGLFAGADGSGEHGAREETGAERDCTGRVQAGALPGSETSGKPKQFPQAVQPVADGGVGGVSAGAARRAPDPVPLSPGRYRLQITIGQKACDTLGELSGLLAHQIPDGDPAVIVELALGLLLEQTRKKKAALSDRPRSDAVGPSRGSRAIPAAIRRAVFARDGGRCAFVGEDGHRCDSTRALEYAHIEPWAKGGAHSVDNIALRCRAHNAYEAVRDYGELFMRRKRGAPPAVREASSTRAVARESGAGTVTPAIRRLRSLPKSKAVSQQQRTERIAPFGGGP